MSALCQDMLKAHVCSAMLSAPSLVNGADLLTGIRNLLSRVNGWSS